MDRLAYKIECVSALAGTSCQYGPDTFAPKLALFTTSALGNIVVYDNKPNRLLSKIIGWFNARCSDEPEISFAVLKETVGKILSLTTVGNINFFKFAAAIRADIKSVRLEIINFFGRKRRSLVLGVPGLAA